MLKYLNSNAHRSYLAILVRCSDDPGSLGWPGFRVLTIARMRVRNYTLKSKAFFRTQ